ncbi:MAG TPA: nuclear transport factor 2 family protein [Solirubrobacteraceae bacterium]|nr:nuclear transport factor 2 family protein [Solirubrobacteraceae bacterium]
MSENLDLVRSIYAAWERGDWTSTEWADSEIEFVIPDGPDAFSSTGAARMAELWREYLSAWEGYRIEADEIRELDDERVLVLSHYSGSGKASGVELARMSALAAQVFYFRDGKVSRMLGYNDRTHALADLGLEE